MFFHKPTPCGPRTSFEHQPPHASPTRSAITDLHKASLSCWYRHNHFPNRALLNSVKLRNPKPPPENGVQTFDQLTKWNLNSSPQPLHKKSRCSFSRRLAIFVGSGYKDIKYVGRLAKVVLISVSLPPLDKYNLFHDANLRSIFSITKFQICSDLKLAPKGKPRYCKGRQETLHCNRAAKPATSGTFPTGTNSDLDRFTFKPDTASKQRSNALKDCMCPRCAPQKMRVSSANNKWEM
ncbi:hypothetical protein I3760_16G075100 [Carya illinoinensis]|nr:hypothetical protein I3760_16G075100 [Carya illinoinensis]